MPIKLLILFVLILITACNTKETRKSREEENLEYVRKLDERIKERADATAAITLKVDRTTLYEVDFYAEWKKEKPSFEKIDKLIKQGFKVNSIHQYSVSRKKLSASIPIVKDFVKETHENVYIEETPLLYKLIRTNPARFNKDAYRATEYLIKKGADLYLTTPYLKGDGNLLPLEVIIQNSTRDDPSFDTEETVRKYVKLFKENGFEMDTINLMYAEGNIELVKYLVKEGVSKKLNVGLIQSTFIISTRWQWAFEESPTYFKTLELDFSSLQVDALNTDREVEEAEVWLKIGLSPNHRSGRRYMPLLFLAIERGDRRLDFTKKLVEHYHADLNSTIDGQNALDFARSRGRPQTIKYLESKYDNN